MATNKHSMCKRASSDQNRMFSSIAGQYDFLNHLLSLNIDRRWRRELAKYARVKPGDNILDVCTGTGDVAIRFAQADDAGEIVGIDLSEEMLQIARWKTKRKAPGEKIKLLRVDALKLPFRDNCFDIVSIGFGLRNIGHYKKGISEMVRILRGGGRLVILEFSPPRGSLFGTCYGLYLDLIIRTVGGVISGSASAYRYLCTSIANFLEPEEIIELMKEEGLKELYSERLSGGIAYIYRGEK